MTAVQVSADCVRLASTAEGVTAVVNTHRTQLCPHANDRCLPATVLGIVLPYVEGRKAPVDCRWRAASRGRRECWRLLGRGLTARDHCCRSVGRPGIPAPSCDEWWSYLNAVDPQVSVLVAGSAAECDALAEQLANTDGVNSVRLPPWRGQSQR